MADLPGPNLDALDLSDHLFERNRPRPQLKEFDHHAGHWLRVGLTEWRMGVEGQTGPWYIGTAEQDLRFMAAAGHMPTVEDLAERYRWTHEQVVRQYGTLLESAEEWDAFCVRLMEDEPRKNQSSLRELVKAESPIEERLGLAMARVNLKFRTQVPIGRWRADFLVMGLSEIPGAQDMRVIVECDGHAAHSTRQQRTRDALRDRAFTLGGYTVMRFTGTEIHDNADACANQVCDLVWTLFDEMLAEHRDPVNAK